MRTSTVESTIGGCLIPVGWTALWIAVICVAWHFISKLW